jgi:hypothetical protein
MDQTFLYGEACSIARLTGKSSIAKKSYCRSASGPVLKASFTEEAKTPCTSSLNSYWNFRG